jgi:hypothetical protein
MPQPPNEPVPEERGKFQESARRALCARLSWYCLRRNGGMDICKNKHSGHYFIFIRNVGTDKMLLVTPKGTIKSLEKKHFSAPLYIGEHIILSEEQIARSQYEAYQTYEKNRGEELAEEFLLLCKRLAPDKLRLLFESLTLWKKELIYRAFAAEEPT